MVICGERCLNILVIATTRNAKSNHVEETALSPLNGSSCKKRLVTAAEQKSATVSSNVSSDNTQVCRI
jgi:hypothetical protein